MKTNAVEQTQVGYSAIDRSQSCRGLSPRDNSLLYENSKFSLLQSNDPVQFLGTEESKSFSLRRSPSNHPCNASEAFGAQNKKGWHPLQEDVNDATNDETVSNLQLTNLSPQQNQTAEANPQQVTTIQQTVPQQVHTAIPLVTEVEARLFYRERIAFFSALAVSSLFLWLMLNHKATFHDIISPLYVYFTYIAVERGIIGYKKTQLETWYKKENRLEFLSAVCCVLALIFLDLKLSGITSTSAIATIPLAISSIIYLLMSIELNSTKARKALYKGVYTAQALLITLKIDKTIDFEWIFILMITLVFLGLIGSACVIYGLLVCFLTYFVIRNNFQDRVLSRKLLFLGLFWHFLYYGLSSIANCIVIGIITVFDPKYKKTGLEFLNSAVFFSTGFNAFLLIFTIIAFNPLVKFTQHFNLDRLFGIPMPQPQQQRPIVSFEVDQRKTYFMSLSTTYFLPLTRNFLAKSKPNIERIKSMFRDSKLVKSFNKQQDNNHSIQQNKPITKQTLHKYKEVLDEKLGNVLKERSERPDKGSNALKFSKMFSPRTEGVYLETAGNNEFAKENKLCLSFGNIDDLEDVYSKPKSDSHREDEKLCYLCYSNPPNSVLMNCGHGGFCYECATAAIKVKNECVECRATVEAIHKIDLEAPQQIGIVKAIETTKVVLTNPVGTPGSQVNST